jgi:hypothetical protein
MTSGSHWVTERDWESWVGEWLMTSITPVQTSRGWWAADGAEVEPVGAGGVGVRRHDMVCRRRRCASAGCEFCVGSGLGCVPVGCC